MPICRPGCSGVQISNVPFSCLLFENDACDGCTDLPEGYSRIQVTALGAVEVCTNLEGVCTCEPISDTGVYVLKAGDSMTGGLSVGVPTATESGLILQSTDDDATHNLLEFKDSLGNLLGYFSPARHMQVGSGLSGTEASLQVQGVLTYLEISTDSLFADIKSNRTIRMYSNNDTNTFLKAEGSEVSLGTKTGGTVSITAGNAGAVKFVGNTATAINGLSLMSGTSFYTTSIQHAATDGTSDILRIKSPLDGSSTTVALFTFDGDFELGHDRAIANTSHKLKSDTTAGRAAFGQETSWIVSADGSRKAITKLFISDWSGEHEALTIKSTGSAVTHINMPNLPTAAAGLVAGDLWNNAGVINII